MRTAYRTCPLCEATCGLAIDVDEAGNVGRIRGDAEDVFSHGFLCPKGVGLKALHDDPDRLRVPLVRGADGELHEASWEEAFAAVERGLGAVLARGDRDAVGIYLGNPTAHSLGAMLYARPLIKALGTRNTYSASTVDQMPKHVSAGLMFGSPATIPVPDVDRTDFLLMLGANPLASNGSLLTAPDMRGRMRAIRARGGRIVVVDPRRTRTALEAGEHIPIRPGTDALLLFALVHVLFAEGLATPDAELCNGIEELHELAEPFTPAAVAGPTGIAADRIQALARDLASAPTAAVYGRIGTTTQAFGTLASWLVDVLNALTGNLDRPGGAMLPQPAAVTQAGRPTPRAWQPGRWHSRVRGLPEALGELPVACLAEEIETPGEGQIRALITVAGNPTRSTPNSARLEAAIEQLEFMVSVDIYRNETSRHADVILPVPAPLEKSHYDVALYGLACRNIANYSPALVELPDGMPAEWETLLRLTAIAAGQPADADIAPFDDMMAGEMARRLGVDAAATNGYRGPERLLDLMLRAGPYDLTLADLEAEPHGIDLGPLEPRLPDALRTPSGRVELAPEVAVADVERLRGILHAAPANGDAGLLLIGRRHLRSNNSWMHNVPNLVGGPQLCTLLVHPDDGGRLGLPDGERALLRSRVGEISVTVELTDAMMPGVVSLPHGWGHDGAGLALRVASDHPGSNVNALVDEAEVDPLSGNAVLNGVPVTLSPVPVAALA